MRWVTFYYDLLRHQVLDLKVHKDRETARKCFNANYSKFFQLSTPFKADKLPASYGYPMRKYYGISARTFKKMFDCDIDEAMRIAESEGKNE